MRRIIVYCLQSHRKVDADVQRIHHRDEQPDFRSGARTCLERVDTEVYRS